MSYISGHDISATYHVCDLVPTSVADAAITSGCAVDPKWHMRDIELMLVDVGKTSELWC